MRNIKEIIYNVSPYWIQNILITYYGKKVIAERYGTIYFDELNRLLNNDYSNYDKEISNQKNELIRFIKFAVNKSPFYQELYEGIDLDKIKTVGDLRLLPIISKEDLRANITKVYTIDEEDAVVSFTGGTTGKSLKVYISNEDMQKRMAYLDAFKIRTGITDLMTARKATFSGRQLIKANEKKRFWRYNKAYNQRLYSTFHLNESNMSKYVEDLNKFKPEIINGFVSAIYDLAHYIDRHNVKLEFVPIAIFTTSESLLKYHRELIEHTFKSKIYNQYASAEGAPFITECKEGNLHYNIDTGVIEQTNISGQKAEDMIVTSFTTHGTPLIRYNIQDRVIFKEGFCICGSSHPLIESIEGRQVDYLTAVDGTKVSLSHLADVIKGIPNSIKKIQFIQRERSELEILLVLDERLYTKKDELKLRESIKYRFGKEIRISMKIVEDIPREKSGKYSLIKNFLK